MGPGDKTSRPRTADRCDQRRNACAYIGAENHGDTELDGQGACSDEPHRHRNDGSAAMDEGGEQPACNSSP
ncbi:hypothetical protein D3C77_632320 [compost metagenome]